MQFFEDEGKVRLYPFAECAPVAFIRIGILSIAEKWALVLPGSDLHINARLMPDPEVVAWIKSEPEASFVSGATQAAVPAGKKPSKTIELKGARFLERPWQIFQWNAEEIAADILRLDAEPIEENSWPGVTIGGSFGIYTQPGAKVEPGSVLLAREGPIYLGRESLIMAGSLVRGSVAVCDHAVLKMGSKVYAETTVGPFCKAGGELQNAVLMAYSNKGHDGYLGNSVVGNWCNLGAGTDTSNLKNNYSSVSVYAADKQEFMETGLQFCGSLIGDHSKTAIGTTLNTGSVLGSFVNLAAGGFPPKHIPSFSWITEGKTERFAFEKAMAMAEAMMKRREITMTAAERDRWEMIFQRSE